MAGMCSRARERGLRSRHRAVTNWIALHLHSLQSTDRYRGKTQWNWSDDRRVDTVLATGRCWSCSLCPRFWCIFIEITNTGRLESRISWLPNPGCVIPRFARASLYVAASRKVQRTGLRVHPFFPKRRESSAPADTTRPKKTHFYHWRTNLLAQSLRLFIFRPVLHAWGFEFSHHRSSCDFKPQATASNSGDVKWKNFGKTSNKRFQEHNAILSKRFRKQDRGMRGFFTNEEELDRVGSRSPKRSSFPPKRSSLLSGVGDMLSPIIFKLDRKGGSKLLLSDNTGLVIAQRAIAEILRSNLDHVKFSGTTWFSKRPRGPQAVYIEGSRWLFVRRRAVAADRPEKRALFVELVNFKRTLQLEFKADK